ncbi:MAG TPA: hypothetical protein VFX91_12180, partial [Alcanivorax sp.]|nr:hypothetical protein [Alcanivorax sp.]
MAKKYDSATKEKAFVAIADHLKKVGDEQWEALRKQFPNVPKATFYRWIKAVKQLLGTDQQELTESARYALEASDHLPVAPSPEYVAKTGANGKSNMDFMQRLDQLYGDAELLREFGVRDGKVVSPKFFGQSINLRRSLLETALKAMAEVWDLRQMQAFYDVVLDEIAKESPECAQRILDRLRDLNAETGMTYEMA